MVLLLRGKGNRGDVIDCLQRLVASRLGLKEDFPDEKNNVISLTYYQIELCDLYEEAGQLDLANDVWRQVRANAPLAVAAAPDDHRLRNILAWHVARQPMTTEPEDSRRAKELAREAIALAPENGAYWNTLGVILYRAGDDKAAVAALEKSMRLRSGGDPYDWIFLSMAHARLAELIEARSWYDRADVWIKANAPVSQELLRFRAEAEHLRRVDQSSPAGCGSHSIANR